MVDFPTPVSPLTRMQGAAKTSTAATRRRGATWPRPCASAPSDMPPPQATGRPRRPRRGEDDREVEQLRSRIREHPCHGCPDREDHARWAERWHKLAPRHPDAAAPDRAAHEHDRAAVRPGLRGARRARLPRRGRRHHDGDRQGPAPDADLHRARPGRRRGAASRGSGTELDAVRAGRGAVGPGVRVPATPTTPARPGCPGDRSSRRSPRWCDSGATSRRSSASTGSSFCREPDLGVRVGGVPVGRGRRPRRGAGRDGPRGRRLRAVGQARRSPTERTSSASSRRWTASP